jgi:hypothetical protein
MITARDLANKGLLYSGYCSVIGLRKRTLKVVASPRINAFVPFEIDPMLTSRYQNDPARCNDV